MACIENVLGGHAPSPRGVVAEECGIREPRPDDMSLQYPSSLPKDDAEPLGHHRVLLRPPLNVLTDLAREQLERPFHIAGACIPVDSSRSHKHPCGSPPAVVEESLATAEVNSSEGLAGWRLRGEDSINVSQDFSGSTPPLMIGGARVSSGGTERGGNNARLYVALPQGQGFFPSRGPQVRDPLHIPTVRSGVIMELPSGNTRMTGKERLAHVSFPPGGLRHPVENWPRPLPLSSSTPGLPSRPTAHCFIPPRPPSFSPFLAMPIAFAPPPIFGPPLPSYFANFPSWGMPAPAPSNRENN
ncbi:proline-rich protein 32 isoform X1 [Acinonyx jubatus]|uniref:Proline-rich protein 32 isoform X1 n=2 Tax=Acinonyx jubatus TaxID=32536 RepID=A0A6J0AB03_ACIJB|nr:proline-rich protein 32 isoform X1 [Acinonyx jubatus]